MTAAAVLCALYQWKGKTQKEQQTWSTAVSQAIAAGHFDGVLTVLHTGLVVTPLNFDQQVKLTDSCS